MTKEEKIKENYINEFQTGSKEEKEKRYENIKPYIDSFGWFSGKLFETNKDNFDVSGHETRPKSLSGIENNNGWNVLKGIKNEITHDGDIWILNKYGNIELWLESQFLAIGHATHWKPVIKPKPPIY